MFYYQVKVILVTIFPFMNLAADFLIHKMLIDPVVEQLKERQEEIHLSVDETMTEELKQQHRNGIQKALNSPILPPPTFRM